MSSRSITPVAVRLPWTCSAEAALSAWPAASPLAALWSGGATRSPRSRWRILAAPVGCLRTPPDAAPPSLALAPPTSDAARSLRPCIPDLPPFLGGWIGVVRYEAGRALEPAASWPPGTPNRPDDPPLAEWLECPAAYVHDAATGAWWLVGDRERADRLPWGDGAGTGPGTGQPPSAGLGGPGFGVKGIASTTGRADFERAVARAVEYIHAGDCFQVNLAHHLVGRFSGSSRAAFIATTSAVQPWYGAYFELPADARGVRRAVLSLSPELFLEFDGASRRVVTRPIKGTRRAGPRSATDLGASAKDHAELAMIIDLMRNDLGRVCRVGSIRVDDPRAIERHAGTLDHGVATVSGTLRDGAGLNDLLAATFPPGSVTGAPKVRAMQIIDELETRPRGVYCGCVGFVSACGGAAFNVAIRTATIEQAGGTGHEFSDATIDLPVGAGIVAESVPASEWQETLDKAEAIQRALNEPGT